MKKKVVAIACRVLTPLGLIFLISCTGIRLFPNSPLRGPQRATSLIKLKMGELPSSGADDKKRPSKAARFYQTWWFWGAVLAAGFVGTTLLIASSVGGTDRVAKGLDGSFDPKTFPNR